MKIIDRLLSALNYEAPVMDIRQGPFQTAVLTSSCGLAATPHEPGSHHEKTPVKEAGSLMEKSAMALAQNEAMIDVPHLSDKIVAGDSVAPDGPDRQGSLKEMVTALEKSVLSQLLAKHSGNRTKIAKELGLSRYGLIKKLQRYNL